MTGRGQLEQAIEHLEAQRALLGDAVVDAALAPLREKLAALEVAVGDTQPVAAERKQVTVMFADISGFTPLSEMLDPEAVRDLINACFERLVPVVERYGGSIDKFMGDNVMALMGDRRLAQLGMGLLSIGDRTSKPGGLESGAGTLSGDCSSGAGRRRSPGAVLGLGDPRGGPGAPGTV